jgi:hypothetical protein
MLWCGFADPVAEERFCLDYLQSDVHYSTTRWAYYLLGLMYVCVCVCVCACVFVREGVSVHMCCFARSLALVRFCRRSVLVGRTIVGERGRGDSK